MRSRDGVRQARHRLAAVGVLFWPRLPPLPYREELLLLGEGVARRVVLLLQKRERVRLPLGVDLGRVDSGGDARERRTG